jgi:hypothetical protein
LSEPSALNTQADRLAAAKAAQSAREAGIRAQAIKQGRELERAELAIQAIKVSAEHAGIVAGINQAHTEEIARLDERWSREEAKHGSGKFWSGMFTGAMCAAAVAAIGTAMVVNMVIGPTYDAASRSQFNAMAVEAITSERPPTTNEPRSESAQ